MLFVTFRNSYLDVMQTDVIHDTQLDSAMQYAKANNWTVEIDFVK